jgi:ParB-like chromosome segregation protein Spo0J
MKNSNLKVEYRAIDTLIPYARNARVHSDDQITQIAASIKEFGFNNPILLDGEKGIIAGHGRYEAAKKLGLKEVPCIELKHLKDSQRRAYILADNKIALNSSWDIDLLKVELEELSDLDPKTFGFEETEIESLLEEKSFLESLDEESFTNVKKLEEKQDYFVKSILFPINKKEEITDFFKQEGSVDRLVGFIVSSVNE